MDSLKDCEEILVLGDSHAIVFLNEKFKTTFNNFVFNVCKVGGATLSGMKNPNTITQAMPIFLRCIKMSKAMQVITLIGEVDTGFLIWHSANKYNISISEALDKVVQNYIEFLTMLSNNFKVICISTPLPVITDGAYKGKVANARKTVKATQKQRIELTFTLNKTIKEFCKKEQIVFVDLDIKSLGNDGLIKPDLLNEDPCDHHYNSDVYADLIIEELKNIL